MTDRELAIKARVVMWKAFRTVDGIVNETFKDYDLTPTQFSVLEVLYRKGSMKVGDLINAMLATSGNMTVVIKNMEKKGYIKRRQCTQDKRAFWIELTDSGRQAVESALTPHQEKIEETMSVLSRQEQEQLISLLKKFKSL